MPGSTLANLNREYKASLAELDGIQQETTLFLKNFQEELNRELGENSGMRISMARPVHKFGENFPLHFDLVLTVDNGGKKEEFILPCTARNVSGSEYRINDGYFQHPFFIDKEHAEENARALAKLADSFAAKFHEHRELEIKL